MLDDLIAATDNLKALNRRQEALREAKTDLQARMDKINTELTQIRQDMRDSVATAKQAANGLKE